MKNIEQIKQELKFFVRKHNICEEDFITGNNYTELFRKINEIKQFCIDSFDTEEEFHGIFNNQLIIENGVLLCNCTRSKLVVIPDSVTSIGEAAFSGCRNLTSVTIPESVISINKAAFQHCNNLKSIDMPAVVIIKKGAFALCKNLTSVIMSDSMVSIENYAFEYCTGLTSITIPNSVISIGDYTFQYCTSLTSVELPESIVLDGTEFKNCISLNKIKLYKIITLTNK